MSQTKTRLDKFLLENGLVSTRSKAQELIKSEKILVDGKPCSQPGKLVGPETKIELLAQEHPYVSRGGVKLEGALRDFSISVKGKIAFDVGQSTGGFTECLLKFEAQKVFGIDVGHSQLHPSLLADPRVVSLEKMDIRNLDTKTWGVLFPLVVVDVSFVSITQILPALCKFLEAEAEIVLLLKPQFEVEPSQLGGGGILRDTNLRAQIIEERKRFCRGLGFTVAGESASKIPGGDGNQETFLHLKWLSSKIEN